MYTYLITMRGPVVGKSCLLDPTVENRIGRAADCEISTNDPYCSLYHAKVTCDEGQWRIRDGQSRNGTFVNEQRVDEAPLGEGCIVSIGATVFTFHESEQPVTVVDEEESGATRMIVKDAPVGDSDSCSVTMEVMPDSEQARDLLVLYQLAIRLLSSSTADEVLETSLDLLLEQTGGTLAGFLLVGDDGSMRPKLVLPAGEAASVVLSETLTQLVATEGRAVWIANQQIGDDSGTLEQFADAICIPMLDSGKPFGAIHLYLADGRFRQSQFDFGISLANITSVALVRARRDARLQSDLLRLKSQSPDADRLIGQSPPMQKLNQTIARLGPTPGCVLIRGESGVGKELVARAIHRASRRAERPMLSVNCAAIPADLMESQLFGHQQGAFTGAERDHVGYFQQADTGTLFLDEVGELTPAGQAKLLRILEGHPFLPVGGTQEILVDVRVIAATNLDLQSHIGKRKFREDLYYRFVAEVDVPPLRDRGEDINRLIDFFLDHFRAQHGRPGLKLTDEARRMMLAYRWPGNVRQLRNVLDSAVVLAGGETIEPADLPLRDAGADVLDSLRIDQWQRKLIVEALKRTGGNVPQAARLLGIGRATLYRKIEEFEIARSGASDRWVTP